MSIFAVLIPTTVLSPVLKEEIESLKAQTLADYKCFFQGEAAGAAVEYADDKRFAVAPENFDNLAKMINWLASDSTSDYIGVMPEGLLLKPEGFAEFDTRFREDKDAVCLYSCYEDLKPNNKFEKVQLYAHEGCPHERFDFGFLKIYRRAAIEKIGGFSTTLVHVAEYDAELKLAEIGKLDLIDKVLYSIKPITEKKDDAASTPSGLYSPGKGKLGGFSYVFYPPDLEAEVTSVFEQALKRRGAWLDKPTVPVDYKNKKYRYTCSVVIPVLNRVKFIGNAIQKVLDGTFQDFEIIIVDNGSTDGTINKVLEYVGKDPRIKLICQHGPSIAYALNTGIRMAAGKLICQLDSDDQYSNETLEKMVAAFDANPNCGLAISYYALMEEDGTPVSGIDPVKHAGYTRNQILRRDGAGALRVFPKIVLEEMGYYDEANYGNFGEDYDMVLKVGEKYDVDRVHEVLYFYRRHPDNTDVTRDPIMKVRNKNNARLAALARRKAINAK
ncbi:MAG: glycosyltransferase [Candidatus Sumerlaeales bacterium]|nr:glycosyltransferase [Candidatus Sumerlaeales bacterium]